MVLDCDRVIPEALRNTFLAGRKLTKNEAGGEITVEVTNRLDRGTRFARTIDQVFTADNVAPR